MTLDILKMSINIREEKMNAVDFYINQRPVSISLTCPHCGMELEIPWDDLNVPEYWGDDWGEIECPYCEKTIKLGDYELE